MRPIAASTLLCLAATLAGPARPADAAFLSYNATFFGSGSLGQVSFTNAQITLSAIGNSDDRFLTPGLPFNLYNLSNVRAVVSIAGIGTATITDSVSLADIQRGSGFAFYDDTLSASGTRSYLLYLNGPFFGNYDLATTAAPSTVTATGGLNQGQTVGTTAGGLTYRPDSFQVTFSVTEAVPEPSSLALCGVAGAIGWASARRRRLPVR